VRDCAVSRNFVANDICKRVAFSQTSTLLGSRKDRRDAMVACTYDANSGASVGLRCSALVANSVNRLRSAFVNDGGGLI
jgi:hypothetical protein